MGEDSLERVQLADDTAVVTGGASGIGRAISLRFAEHGADVVVADINRDPRSDGVPTHEAIRERFDSQATFVECDVTDLGDIRSAMEAAEKFGGVDIMVNNAGVFSTNSVFEITEADYYRVMDTNVKGALFGSQIAAEYMDDGGRIVNMSSTSGLEGRANWIVYCASKGAVRTMTYALADALGPHGIRVNAIHPGLILTDMTTEDVPRTREEIDHAIDEAIPLRRGGTAEDVADAALYLVSSLGEYVSGESLVIDGGMTNT